MWLPLEDTSRNVAAQREDPGSVLHLVRDLIALRRERDDLRRGAYATLPAPDGAWVCRRGDGTTVALNLSDAPVTLDALRRRAHRHRPGVRGRAVRRHARPVARRGARWMRSNALLSDEGWPYASTPPVEEGDPGRFHALFGRDSLITALQLLPVRPDVADATLRALAARQGTREHPGTLEEPGKIGHEFRDRAPEQFIEAGWPDEGAFAYYGTADATSWFLVLAARRPGGRVRRRRARGGGLARARALDRGDGLVRHAPGSWPALTQQGWRDGFDPTTGHGIGSAPDGDVPEPPLADTDSQAVAYAALRADRPSTIAPTLCVPACRPTSCPT